MFLFRRFGLYAAATAVLLSVLLPVAASAQTPPARPPLSLMTSPLPLNVVTKPGQTVTADIRVKNNSTRPEVLKVELLKFGASGDTGRPQIQERDPNDVYFDWVSFSETNFRAEPNVWKTIKMTINAPKEAAFGYYFAVLFSRANPDKPTTGTSGVEGGVASLVLLNVDAPGAKREAKVAELVASQKVYEFLPAKFTVKLRNSGNIHVSPVGNVFLKQGNKQVATLAFNDERGNILPGTNRKFDITWDKGFPVYEEKKEGSETKKSLRWDFNELQNFRIGKYTATLVAVYDDGQRDVPIEAVVSFWVIPWRILGAILLVFLLVGVGIWGIFRLLWKNIRRQASMPVSDSPDPDSLAGATRKNRKNIQPESVEGAKKVDTPASPGGEKATTASEKVIPQVPAKEQPTIPAEKEAAKAASPTVKSGELPHGKKKQGGKRYGSSGKPRKGGEPYQGHAGKHGKHRKKKKNRQRYE